MNCEDNALGVVNTICTIVFGTQHPFKANGTIRAVFDGMTIATDACSLAKNIDGAEIPVLDLLKDCIGNLSELIEKSEPKSIMENSYNS